MTHSPADLAAAATQPLPFEPADVGRYAVAYAGILEFEAFVLDRFAAWTRHTEVHANNEITGIRGRERVIQPIDDAKVADSGGYGRWHVDRSWLLNTGQHHITVYHYLSDDRGPGSRTATVQVPKAWIFGETERAEARAAYEALRPAFEESGRNPDSPSAPARIEPVEGESAPDLWHN